MKPTKLTADLYTLTKSQNTTLFNLMASALSIFLYRYFGQEDISLHYPVNIRPKVKGAKKLFGFFVNELGLRTQLSGELTFSDAISSIKQQRALDSKYQHYPLIEKLLTRFRPVNPGLSFPFNVGLGATSFFKKLVVENVTVQSIDSFINDEVISDLLFLYENDTTSTQLEFAIEYNSNIFEADFIYRL